VADAGPDTRTLENYRSCLRCHILPRFGTIPIEAITPLDIRMWSTQAFEDGYAPATVGGWKNLLSMIFTDAVDEGLVAANPVRKHRRRGRRCRHLRPERIWATPEQVLAVADQAGVLGGPTGCRWGELAGLHRDNVDLHHGVTGTSQCSFGLTVLCGRCGPGQAALTRWCGLSDTSSGFPTGCRCW
jgi:integrase